MAEHRATPEQWADVKGHSLHGSAPDSAILELRDRLAAAEQRISELVGNHPAKPDSSAPAGSLVEVVAAVITDDPEDAHLWHPEACAAILAVAEWLKKESEGHLGNGAHWTRKLREEVERG